MKTPACRLLVTLLLFLCLQLEVSIAFARNIAPAGTPRTQDIANLPVCFEANAGQADPAVKFLAHGCYADLLLTGNEAWLSVRSHGTQSTTSPGLRLGLAGANPTPELAGVDPLPARVNYFIGNNAAAWHANVPVFARVKYSDVYPGVDLIYHGNQQRLEYDFVIQPKADPSRITLEFGGVQKLNIAPDGDLLLRVESGSLRFCKPVVYQEIGSSRKFISGSFVMRSASQIGFRVGDYDHGRPLIIDPVISYSFILGGTKGDTHGLAIAVDTNDNAYITGNTMATDFPIANAYQTNFNGSQEIFISEFDTNGAMLFSTFLGGNGVQSGQGIAVDTNGNIFVTGYTSATNFPTSKPLQTTNGGGYDAFVTELSPGGQSLVFSTYLGGSGFDAANGLVLDTNDSPIVTGYTQSTNFPTSNAVQSAYGGNGDAFVAKLDPTGSSLMYSTYFGGSDSENNGVSTDINPVANLTDVLANLGGAVASDFNGNAYITGWTYSTNLPVLNAFQSSNTVFNPGSYATPYIAKFDPSGNLVYSTYFGGGYSDFGRAIGVDFSNDVYIAGSWYSYDLPATNATSPGFNGSYSFTDANNPPGDGFIAELDATGTNLLWCTYLGGSGDEQINGMSVRPDGAVAVTGWTDSPNFPLTNPTQGATEQGIFKSTTGGNNWTATRAGVFPIFAIGVDPINPANVYLINQGGLFQSTNSGANWTDINFSISSPAIAGASQNLIAFDPLHEGVLYVGANGGVFKTTNSGGTWTTLTNGLPPSLQIPALAVDPHNPSTIYANTFTGGVNGLYQSTNAGSNWTALNTGLDSFVEVTSLLIDPLNSSNVYAGLWFNFSGSALYKSTDAGQTWNGLKALPSFGDGVMAMAADPASLTNIYVLLGGGESTAALCLTTDGGTTWSNLLVASNQNLTTLALGAPSKPTLAIARSATNVSVFWPASFTGYALQSTRTLTMPLWTNVTQASQVTGTNDVVSLALPSSSNSFFRLNYTNTAPLKSTLYVGTDVTGGQGVLQSPDGGNTWNEVGLAGQTVNVLATSPANPNAVYAGLAGSIDAFVTTFAAPAPYRVLYFSTYLGGSGADSGNAIAIDPYWLSAFVTGSTRSPDFPSTGAPLLHGRPLDVTPVPEGLNHDDEIRIKDFEALQCLDPTNPPIDVTIHAGVKTAAYLGETPWGTTIVSVQGAPPNGITYDIAVGHSASGYFADAEFKGTTTQLGTFTSTVTYYNPLSGCTWVRTVVVTVEPFP